MTADVIDLPGRRIKEAADRISRALRSFETRKEPADWEVRWEARKAARKRQLELLAEERARPTITPDDPIIALWDAYKEAKATYDAALSDMARQRGVAIVNMAAILRSVRRKHKAKVAADLHDLPEGVLPI